MSKATNHVQAFIAMNTVAFNAAAKVFSAIEAQSDKWAESLAEAGIVGPDIKVYAIMWVSKQSGIAPKDGQRGLCFEKDSKEASRVKYLVAVATGAAAEKAARRGALHAPVKVNKAKVSAIVELCAGLTKAEVVALLAAARDAITFE
jgi:hypothetical protein